MKVGAKLSRGLLEFLGAKFDHGREYTTVCDEVRLVPA